MLLNGSGDAVITDFDEGIDAIDFMIQSFGFDDLSAIKDGPDAVITDQGPVLRVVEAEIMEMGSAPAD